jgi:hypothetical protein
VIWRIDILLGLLAGMLVLYGILRVLDKATNEFRSINLIVLVAIFVLILAIFTMFRLEIFNFWR